MAGKQVFSLAQEVQVAADLAVDVISDPREFLRSREEWDGLVAQSGVAHPYLSHAWLSAWWESFGAGHDLRVFVVRSGTQWVAAAPMMIRRATMYGVPLRRLEALFNDHTPRYEFPIRDRSPEVYRMLWGAMSDSQGKWDAIVLQQFTDNSPALPALESFAQQDGWRTGRWLGAASPFIRLESDYESLFNRLSTRERSNLRRRHNKLGELGKLELEVVTSRSEVAAAMKDGLRIEAAAWKGRAGTAINSDPQVEKFYLDFARQAADIGWLRLAFLRLGGKRIAFHYMLDTGSTVYGMKMGYDPGYHTYSPGNTLLSLILQKACREGRKEFDLQGGSDPWKLAWTRETRTHPWLFMFRDGVRGRVLHHAKFVVLPVMRRKEHLMRFAESISGIKRVLKSIEASE